MGGPIDAGNLLRRSYWPLLIKVSLERPKAQRGFTVVLARGASENRAGVVGTLKERAEIPFLLHQRDCQHFWRVFRQG